MRSMGHPHFEYRPWPQERRAKLSAIHRSRLGIPDGHARVYGVHVPLECADALRPYAGDLARLRGYDAAHQFMKNAAHRRWAVPQDRPSPEKIVKSDPRYVYTPRPDAVRQNMRALARERLGWLEGHDRIFGVCVPLEHSPTLRPWAAYIARADGFEAARDFLLDARAGGWPSRPHPRAITAIARFSRRAMSHHESRRVDWELVDALLAEGVEREQLAEYLGLSLKHLRAMLRGRKSAGRSVFGSGKAARPPRLRVPK